MSHLLLEIKANRAMNQSLFAHTLKIYENKMIYHERKYIYRVTEITISYNHVAQVYLTKGLFFSSIELINTGGIKDIIIKYVEKSKAEHAKRLIDAKIHTIRENPFSPQTFNAEQIAKKKENQKKGEMEIESVELALSRLDELLVRKKISKKEYEKKRKNILQNLK